MLVCRKCGCRVVIAEFEVPIRVLGRVATSGIPEGVIPDKFVSRYSRMTNIKVECEADFKALKPEDAKSMKCMQCGHNKFDEVTMCPECGAETDNMVYCGPAARVVCVNCASKSWCRGCDRSGCKFYEKSATPWRSSSKNPFGDDSPQRDAYYKTGPNEYRVEASPETLVGHIEEQPRLPSEDEEGGPY